MSEQERAKKPVLSLCKPKPFVGPPVRTSFTVNRLLKTEKFPPLVLSIVGARYKVYRQALAKDDPALTPAQRELLQWRCLWWRACLFANWKRIRQQAKKAKAG